MFWQHGGMRPTTYRRNARGLRDRQAFEHVRMQAGQLFAAVIGRLTGVAYHPGHVWKLLRHRLRYRLQRPARRAVERDEAAIARWVATDWPRIRQQRPAT